MDRCNRSRLKIFELQNSTEELAQRCSCSPLAAAVLQMGCGEDVYDTARMKAWLSPRFENEMQALSLGHNSKKMANIWKDNKSFGHVVVYGDYDVDGVSSTVLAMELFQSKAIDVEYFIPRRDVQGYGLHRNVLRQLINMGCNTLVVVDCGTKDKLMLDALTAKGINVFVFDHHSVDNSEAYWDNVINPQIDGDDETKKLCATAVLWFWAWKEGIASQQWLQTRMDLVALATIADCMPLNLLNRSLVQQGMNQMRSQPRYGLRCLFEKLYLNRLTLSEEQLSMKVIPCLNAPGRIECADLSVRALSSGSDAPDCVAELIALNKKRQAISDDITERIWQLLDNNSGFSHVLYDGSWPIGVLSSVASRICNIKRTPVALAAPIRGQIRGTLRVPEGVNAVEILNSISSDLAAWGGHNYAAGFSVECDKWDDVQNKLESILSSAKIKEGTIQAIRLHPAKISISEWRAVSCLGPFGNSNPYPYFYFPSTGKERSLPLGRGKQHSQIEIDEIRLLAFNGSNVLETEANEAAGWIYHPRLDYWRGEERMQFLLDYVVCKDC